MPVDEVVMAKEMRDLERKRAMAEASEANFKKTFSSLLKEERIRQGLARDALEATQSRSHDPKFDAVGRGAGEAREAYGQGEVITGNEEALKRLLGDKFDNSEVYEP